MGDMILFHKGDDTFLIIFRTMTSIYCNLFTWSARGAIRPHNYTA